MRRRYAGPGSVVLALVLMAIATAQVWASGATPEPPNLAELQFRTRHPELTQAYDRSSVPLMRTHRLSYPASVENLSPTTDGNPSPQKVIGSDDRIHVTPAISTVVYLQVQGQSSRTCTGVMIGPSMVLTAAHCLHHPDFGGFASHIVVIPGSDGDAAPYGVHEAQHLSVPNTWVETQSPDWDWGFLTLATPVGNDIGWETLGALSTSALESRELFPLTIGYPSDKPAGTQWAALEEQLSSVTATELVTRLDADGGQDGSPVYGGEEFWVVGIMTRETSSNNRAVRVRPTMINHLLDSCADLGCEFAYWADPSVEPDPTATSTPVTPSSTATTTTTSTATATSTLTTTSTSTTTATASPTATSTSTVSPTSTATATATATSTATTTPTVVPTETPPTSPSPTPSQDSAVAFDRTWARTDRPVWETIVNRTWMWGPKPFTDLMVEPYQEAEGDWRTVVYYDKSRMEITTDPNVPMESPWYVTNGLLATELITGQMQVGHNEFVDRDPAQVNVAGDPDDETGPTYATFLGVLDAAPVADSAVLIQRIDRNGNVTTDASLEQHGAYAAYRVQVPGLDHQVASPFWAFMTASGTVYENGDYLTAQLFENAFYATGYPITEAYWATVKVAGTYQDVLMQCFERRCLTYTPGNVPGWEVEAGNVGQHYYRWRYDMIP